AGSLAGREGPYARTIALALTADHLTPPSQPDSRWPTFAGSLRRSKVVSGPIDVGSMQWRVEIEKIALNRTMPFGMRGGIGAATASASPERLLAFHPIVLGDQVIICDGTQVL